MGSEGVMGMAKRAKPKKAKPKHAKAPRPAFLKKAVFK
jgi:hypothetical protein